MKKLFSPVILFLFTAKFCFSQHISLGVYSGFENTFRDERIGGHGLSSAFLQITLDKNWSVKIAGFYWQKKYYGSQWIQEYRGTTYTARDAQLWRDTGLSLGINRTLYKGLYLGSGIDINLIKFKRITHFPLWPIIYIWTGNVYPNIIEDRDLSFGRIGLSQSLGWEFKVVHNIIGIVELRYKYLFAGRDFGFGALSLLESYAFNAGFKYQF